MPFYSSVTGVSIQLWSIQFLTVTDVQKCCVDQLIHGSASFTLLHFGKFMDQCMHFIASTDTDDKQQNNLFQSQCLEYNYA